eukprot:COSAG02_NODE_3811_length_6194_cov_2.390320_4_plen_257_part_00
MFPLYPEQVVSVVDDSAGLNWVDVATAATIGWSTTGLGFAVQKTAVMATVAMLVKQPSYLLFLSGGCGTDGLFASFVKPGSAERHQSSKVFTRWPHREQILPRLLTYCREPSDCKDEKQFDEIFNHADIVFGKRTIVEHQHEWLCWTVAHNGGRLPEKKSMVFEDAVQLVKAVAQHDLLVSFHPLKGNKDTVLSSTKDKLALLSLPEKEYSGIDTDLRDVRELYTSRAIRLLLRLELPRTFLLASVPTVSTWPLPA